MVGPSSVAVGFSLVDGYQSCSIPVSFILSCLNKLLKLNPVWTKDALIWK